MKNSGIDGGREFDWGRTSVLYAKYRDIYPDIFYRHLTAEADIKNDCTVLDIGTGTGVVPRNLYSTGARFTGVDISENQIIEARRLALDGGMNITFDVSAAENCCFQNGSFDVITACQCFTYFNHTKMAKKAALLLKDGGRFAVTYMGWLPYEDEIAAMSENLIKEFNPDWTGYGDRESFINVPECYKKYFRVKSQEHFPLNIEFTREGWHGRILACRGVAAALDERKLKEFDCSHRLLLEVKAPYKFTVKHYAAITILEKL